MVVLDPPTAVSVVSRLARHLVIGAVLATALVVVIVLCCAPQARAPGPSGAGTASQSPGQTPSQGVSTTTEPRDGVTLPNPQTEGTMSLEQAIQSRRSVRDYAQSPLSLTEVGQLLWAAQGVTSVTGGRAAPSAGGLYPLELYVVVGAGLEVDPGVYHYLPQSHSLHLLRADDVRDQLAQACLGQEWVSAAPVDFVIAAVYERTTQRYGERGIRYVHMEAGHAAQNLCLQATALGLGAVTVGAFTDEEVSDALGLPDDARPLYVIPVGRKGSD